MMIRVRLETSDTGRFHSLEVKGHEGGKLGDERAVCNAISVLVQTFIDSSLRFLGKELFQWEVKPGDSRIKLVNPGLLKGSQADIVMDTLTGSLLIGVKGIINSSPKRVIELKIHKAQGVKNGT
jgi:uncharacterized protein YsxB (DUF464 family)